MDEDAVVTKLEKVWRARVTCGTREQLEQWRQREPDMEHRLSIPTPTSQRLLVLVCKRYGLSVYRRPRLRSSTLCVKAPAGFMGEVLWPLFEAMARVVEDAADEATNRIMDRWSGGGDETSRVARS
jgi:hypothetical protein